MTIKYKYKYDHKILNLYLLIVSDNINELNFKKK